MEADRRQDELKGRPWAARLSSASARAAATTLRLRADALGAFVGDELWLRGPAMDERLDHALRLICPAARFSIYPGSEDELVLTGDLLPSGRLPRAKWVALKELFPLNRPASAIPATLESRVTIGVVRSSIERPATMLRTSLKVWAKWAASAPTVRLQRLRFAATADEALIAGEPLPPIVGTRLWERGGIVVPCGGELSPAIDAATMRRVLNLDEKEMALFREDGEWELIPSDAFVQARRSAVRMTLAAEGM